MIAVCSLGSALAQSDQGPVLMPAVLTPVSSPQPAAMQTGLSVGLLGVEVVEAPKMTAAVESASAVMMPIAMTAGRRMV